MPTTANIRRVSLSMAIVIAMITVLLPLCMMVECGMSAGEMVSTPGLGFSSQCKTTMTSVAQAAVDPGNPFSLIVLLFAAFAGALALTTPPLSMRLVRTVAEDPPAPPEDPRGVRLII